MSVKPLSSLVLAACVFACAAKLSADPVPVCYVQGSTRAFLVLKDHTGHRLAFGDLVQVVHGSRVTTRVSFHFRDGSLDDELTTFTQQGTFRLLSDRHTQRGPSFPEAIESIIDVARGTVVTRSSGKDGKPKIDERHLDMPPDLSNGIAATLIGNIAFNVPKTTFGYVASTSSSTRLVRLVVSPVAEEPVILAGGHFKAMNFAVHIDLGKVAGVVAPLLGKQPDDLHVWVLGGEVPLILAEEGQFYPGGPIWRVELAAPEWPSR